MMSRRCILATKMRQVDAETAQALAGQIASYARANQHRKLLVIADDPETPHVLDLMTEGDRRQSIVHLDAARRWRQRANEKARSKLDAVEKAISEFDVVLARGILRKVDWKLLDEPTLDRYNTLSLDVAALAVDVEDLESRIPAPEPDEKKGRRFWNRS